MRRHWPAMLLLPLLLPGLCLAQGTYYRAADGAWRELPVQNSEAAIRFTLTPQLIGGGETLVVLGKPPWMVLADTAAPQVTNLLVAGQQARLADLDFGWLPAAPAEIVLALRDDDNPLDLAGLRVTLNSAPLDPARLTVAKLGNAGKQLRVAMRLAGLPDDRYLLRVEVTDLAPARNSLQVQATFNTAPLLRNGGFEAAGADNSPTAWSAGVWSRDADTKYDISVKSGGAVGENALCLTGLAGSLNMVCSQPTADLKPGVTYVYTGQYKSAGGCGLSVITTLGGQEMDYISQGLPAAADWTPFAWEFQVQDHDSALVAVRSGEPGESWFDDLKVVPKPADR